MMNETGKSRIDRWLPVVATVVLFRVLLIPVEALTSTLGVGLGRIPYEFIQHIRRALTIFAPVIAVALAVLVGRAVEGKVMALAPPRKRALLVVLAVLALLPWQLQIKTTARVITWDEMPEEMKKEMGLQQSAPPLPSAPAGPSEGAR
jgi:hypothetical protein